MIEIENLTRRHGGLVAVDEVTFHVDRGEVVGLLGHNGAGKPTIMKMLTGFWNQQPATFGLTISRWGETHAQFKRALATCRKTVPSIPR